jgi:hypothetical protein
MPNSAKTRARGGSDQQRGGRHLGTAPAQGEDATMDRKAGNCIHHRLASGIDRCSRRQGQVGQTLNPIFSQQHRLDHEPAGPHGGTQHHLALNHKDPFPTGQIALFHGAEGSDAGIVWIVDGDGGHHR